MTAAMNPQSVCTSVCWHVHADPAYHLSSLPGYSICISLTFHLSYRLLFPNMDISYNFLYFSNKERRKIVILIMIVTLTGLGDKLLGMCVREFLD